MLCKRFILLFIGVVLCAPVFGQIDPEEVVAAIVKLEAEVPEAARTAAALGTERSGSAVVIDSEGLALTIGYLIMEASAVSISDKDGNMIQAKIVAYNNATGFGLVRAERPLGIGPVEFGDSGGLQTGDPALVISHGGPQSMLLATVAARRDFAGYWEYLLEDAIFTSPAHPRFGGAALIGPEGRLVGIGSLIVPDAAEEGVQSQPGNMFVPINALKPILGELIAEGNTRGPRSPWIGVFTEMDRGHLFVTRVAEDGPAQKAGVEAGDIILKVGNEPVESLADFFRKMWALGEAGVDVPLSILRKSQVKQITVRSADRYKWLRFQAELGFTAMLGP
ncbi:MAG: S1C family serine protease [Gammaproteobacteria bacterium]